MKAFVKSFVIYTSYDLSPYQIGAGEIKIALFTLSLYFDIYFEAKVPPQFYLLN